jgi:hypothetical protein
MLAHCHTAAAHLHRAVGKHYPFPRHLSMLLWLQDLVKHVAGHGSCNPADRSLLLPVPPACCCRHHLRKGPCSTNPELPTCTIWITDRVVHLSAHPNSQHFLPCATWEQASFFFDDPNLRLQNCCNVDADNKSPINDHKAYKILRKGGAYRTEDPIH